jgi:hypothetical protein
MNHKAIILWVWFPVTFVIVLLDIAILRTTYLKKQHDIAYTLPQQHFRLAQSSFSSEQVLGASITAGDARDLLLKGFLQKHASPLADFASYIVNRADYYAIDFRLVPAISMCESIGGKRMPTHNSHNAWGISVEDGQVTGANFNNWLYAIDWVSKYIREKYINMGLTSPLTMGAKWAPSSVEKGNSWANCVDFFIAEIE